MERKLLNLLQFNVSLKASEYAKYYFELRTLAEKQDQIFPAEPLDREGALKLEVRHGGQGAQTQRSSVNAVSARLHLPKQSAGSLSATRGGDDRGGSAVEQKQEHECGQSEGVPDDFERSDLMRLDAPPSRPCSAAGHGRKLQAILPSDRRCSFSMVLLRRALRLYKLDKVNNSSKNGLITSSHWG